MQMQERRRDVLKFFYERANGNRFHKPFSDAQSQDENVEVETACYHLRDQGLLEWYGPIGSRFEGGGRITGRGVTFYESMENPSASTVSYHFGSAQNVQIGDGNTMNVGDVAQRVMAAIDASGASPEEKAEVKSLWTRIINNQTFAAIVGALVGAGFTAAKGS